MTRSVLSVLALSALCGAGALFAGDAADFLSGKKTWDDHLQQRQLQDRLCAAIRRGRDLPEVKRLLKEGASPNSGGSTTFPPLFHAASVGWVDAIRLLAKAGANVDGIPVSENAIHPLGEAARKGRLKAVRSLLALGANIEFRAAHKKVSNHDDPTRRKKTALHYAAQSGQTEAVQLLLKEGASSLHQDALGRTPCHWAALNNHKGIVRALWRAAPTTKSLLINAVITGESNKVDRLLSEDNGGLADRDVAGWTALHWAATLGDLSMARVLLSNGAKPVSEDTGGYQPIYYAAMAGSSESCKALLSKGARFAYSPSHSGEALVRAVESRNYRMTEFL